MGMVDRREDNAGDIKGLHGNGDTSGKLLAGRV